MQRHPFIPYHLHRPNWQYRRRWILLPPQWGLTNGLEPRRYQSRFNFNKLLINQTDRCSVSRCFTTMVFASISGNGTSMYILVCRTNSTIELTIEPERFVFFRLSYTATRLKSSFNYLYNLVFSAVVSDSNWCLLMSVSLQLWILQNFLLRNGIYLECYRCAYRGNMSTTCLFALQARN